MLSYKLLYKSLVLRLIGLKLCFPLLMHLAKLVLMDESGYVYMTWLLPEMIYIFITTILKQLKLLLGHSLLLCLLFLGCLLLLLLLSIIMLTDNVIEVS